MRGVVKARRHPRRGAAAWRISDRGRPARWGRRDRHAGPMCQWRIEEAHFYNYANGARGLSGLGQPVGFGLRERRGQREPARPKVEWAARSAGTKARKKNF
jgi:hypothetical protein